jgi:hypothetical protein
MESTANLKYFALCGHDLMRAVLLSAVLLSATSPAAFAGQTIITPTRDATLYQNSNGIVADGLGQYVFIGRVDVFQPAATRLRRSLFCFDVASAVPAGATITSAVLRLNMSKTISGSYPAVLCSVSRAWGEGASDAAGEEGGGTASASGDATWLHTFYPTSFWGTAGGTSRPPRVRRTRCWPLVSMRGRPRRW